MVFYWLIGGRELGKFCTFLKFVFRHIFKTLVDKSSIFMKAQPKSSSSDLKRKEKLKSQWVS